MRARTEMTPLSRRLAVLAPLLVLLAFAAGWAWAFARMYEVRRLVAHTHVVIETAERTQADLLEAESMQRAYLLTGDAAYVTPYSRAVAKLRTDTAALRSLTRDNASQQQRLDSLAEQVAGRLALLERGLQLRRIGADTAISQARLEQGRARMERVHATMHAVQAEEERLLDARVAAEQRRLVALALLFGLGVVLVGAVAYWVNHTLVRYARTEQESRERMEEQNEELQQQSCEMELQAENLEQQATELELLNEELEQRTRVAEEARSAAEEDREKVRRLSAELRNRVSELETMFELLPIGISIAYDPGCLNIRVNPYFARLLRVRPDENVSSGRPDADVALPYTVWRRGEPVPVEDLPMQLAARTGRAVEGVDIDLRFHNGDVLHLYGWAAPLLDHEGKVRGAVAGYVDMTEREEGAREIQRRIALTEKMYAFASQLSGASTPAQVAAVACESGRDVLGATAAIFCVFTPDGTALEPLHTAGFSPEAMGRWSRIPLAARTPMVEALHSGRTVWLPSASLHDHLYPNLGAPPGLEAVMAGALRFEERALGGWAAHFDAVRIFSDEDVRLFEALTLHCAQALERTRLLEAERRARAAAEAANEAKLKFLRVMSHDLRTPLNAILGYTELLQEGVPGPLNDHQGTYLARVRASTAVLRTLIDEILEFARIEAGRIEIHTADVPVSKLLDSVEAVVAPQVRSKQIMLRRGTAESGLAVRADPDRARQVLMNLVANALKFTAEGGEIRLDCEADPDRVRIAVRDNGVGIPAGQLERIFEPFVQAHRPEELGTEQGVGLGLAISRELARAMEGEVSAAGELGRGSIFTLELPRAPLPALPPAPVPVTSA